MYVTVTCFHCKNNVSLFTASENIYFSLRKDSHKEREKLSILKLSNESVVKMANVITSTRHSDH